MYRNSLRFTCKTLTHSIDFHGDDDDFDDHLKEDERVNCNIISDEQATPTLFIKVNKF